MRGRASTRAGTVSGMSEIKPLRDLVEAGWANALADVEPQVHRMGQFLREETREGHPWLPASRNILRAAVAAKHSGLRQLLYLTLTAFTAHLHTALVDICKT